MSSIIDKRKAKRSIIRIKVFESESDKQIGNTIDLNSDGMLLVGADEFSLGQEMYVRLEHTFKTSKNITLKARVVWHMASVKAGMYNTGFYFIDATPEQSKFIEALIDELAM